MSSGRSKWWGWGKEGKTYHLPDPAGFWAYLRSRLGATKPSERIASLDEIRLRPSRLPAATVAALTRAAGEQSVSSESARRAAFSLGKSYKDLVRIRRGKVPNPTDAIVRPEAAEQVQALVGLAAREGIALIPFGGGTSVVGGVEPAGDRPVITLDTSGLDRVIRIDRESATATLEAGIMGPDLERRLSAAGFTLGHFPQSFEHSTVGGWIAARSSGQQSTLYGKIDRMVQSVKLASPGGLLTTPSVPAAAAGPDLVQLIAGSEGTLGVITEATLRLTRAPAHRDFRGYLFPTFAAGVTAAREIMQTGLHPAVLRVSDEPETESTLALRSPPHGLAAVKESAGRWYLSRRGLRLASASIMILGFEGEEPAIRYGRAASKPILRRHGAVSLGRSAGEAWLRSRFEAPYLRDLLLDNGVLVDTLETATAWDAYLRLHTLVRDALRSALGERCVVMAHLSHSYTDGGSIYYTFLAPQEPGGEIEQWERVKTAATDAIVGNGGALSHHHGIGADHRRWMESFLGPEGARWLSAVKTALDPDGIMNPGKLIPDPQQSSG